LFDSSNKAAYAWWHLIEALYKAARGLHTFKEDGKDMGIKTPTMQELAAKQAISEVIHRYCRGMDRMDKELTLSCWHPGGTDDHAPLFAGTAEAFVEWLWPVHGAMLMTRHVVSNIIIELQGDHAGAETYWTVFLRVPQGNEAFDIIGGGRYVDRFECIDGVWALRHRQSILDWDRVDPVKLTMMDFSERPLIEAHDPDVPATIGSRDRSDFSYSVIGKLLGFSGK
jgi:hypothetical protein